MSRAFVRETDDAPPPPLLERVVSLAPNLVTPRGADRIVTTVAMLQAQLAASGDGKSGAVLRRDLRYWGSRQASMRIVEPDPHPACAGFATRVTIRRANLVSEVAIVGDDEADPPTGRIAWTAPLARALDGAEPGDTIEFAIAGRLDRVTVIAVAAAD